MPATSRIPPVRPPRVSARGPEGDAEGVARRPTHRRFAFEYAPLALALLLFILARVAWTGGDWTLDLSRTVSLAELYAFLLVGLFPFVVGAYMFRVTHRQPGRFAAFRVATWRSFRREYFSLSRIMSGIGALCLLALFVPVFLQWKADIGGPVPFSWDERFMNLDRILHFGRHPWEWLHPILGRAEVTRVIDVLYGQVWTIGAKPLIFLLMGWSSNRPLALRFMLSYFLLWIVLGTVLAYTFASAGPVYYSSVVGGGHNPYLGLLDYLATVDAAHGLHAVFASNLLWDWYAQGHWPRVGISAMPSLHVAIAALVAILGFHLHRIWGILASAYLLVVVVGSVHLAWHYAVDAYLSLALVWPIWWASGRIVRWLGRPGLEPAKERHPVG